jgi:hypothetical protein
MSTRSFEKYTCWRPDRIPRVINTQAVSVDRVNFLATHAPFGRIAYLRKPRAATATGENGVLQELRDRSTEDLHTFVVIQGIPGTGKSHLIRWLKERYATEAGDHDVVLLIERAGNSLRGTLEQVIQSGIFDETAMREQLQRLKGATITLSRDGLADDLLNHLQVAVKEVPPAPEDQLHPRVRPAAVEEFLLDPNVRIALERNGGPIDRLMRFLSLGGRSMAEQDDLPRFQESDLEFPLDTLRAIRNGGYDEVRKLAENLGDKREIRTSLTRFLNRRLRFAIGHAVALSADDIKQMFDDLRRQLRRQGRGLALFVEDITASTGIDTGLIDVLVTQHTGEGDREFCRLISVIGVTDSYYQDDFPDNLKERVTHHLTLNMSTPDPNEQESEFLTTVEAIAGLSARYLNAMRVTQEELDSWLLRGGSPENLPNACTTCPHRLDCHAAFGTVDLGTGGDERLRTGLYPFNRRALATMYRNLTSRTKTPRSLLNGIIEYVLVNHGNKVEEGNFPPRAQSMGSDFRAPTLERPAHRRTIEAQGGADADRIESLLLYWGDRTAYSRTENGMRTLGDLSDSVFRAFAVPMIEGEVVTSGSSTDTKTPNGAGPGLGTDRGTGTGRRAETSIGTGNTDTGSGAKGDSTAGGGTNASTAKKRLVDSITEWDRGGQLVNYERLIGFLEQYLFEAIDWESHGISSAHLEERFERRRLYIEGQAGQSRAADHLTFRRSAELRDALIALAEYDEVDLNAEPQAVAGRVTSLSIWLQSEEERIVEFVRQPCEAKGEIGSLIRLLVLNCALIEWLRGGLAPERSSPEELLWDVVRSCVDPTKWDAAAVSESVSPIRGRLARGIVAEDVKQCRRYLLATLNCVQGNIMSSLTAGDSSQHVRFIDAASALDALRELDDHGWALPPFSGRAVAAKPGWDTAVRIHQHFQQWYQQAVTQDKDLIKVALDRLAECMAGASAEQSIAAIDSLVSTLRKHQAIFSFDRKSDLTPASLLGAQQRLRRVLQAPAGTQQALAISASADVLGAAKLHLDYFEGFLKFATKEEQDLAARIERLKQLLTETDQVEQAEKEYSELEKTLELA